MGDFLLVDEKKLESLLSSLLSTCTQSIPFPGSQRIPSVHERAEELLADCSGDVAVAAELAAKTDDEVSWRARLPDVLLQQVPIVGNSTIIVRELWRSIRRCAVIAHLYGHDLEAAETQAQILTCLISTGGGTSGGVSAGTGTCGQGGGSVDGPERTIPEEAQGGLGPTHGASVPPRASSRPEGAGSAGDVVSVGSKILAASVSRALVREVLVRATGIRYAGQLYRLFEAAGALLGGRKSSGQPKIDRSRPGDVSAQALTDSSATLTADVAMASPQVGATASSAHAHQEGVNQSESSTSAAKLALIVFRPPAAEEHPGAMVGMLFLWLLPIFLAAVRFFHARMVPVLGRRVKMELSVGKVVVLMLALQAAGFGIWVWVQRHRASFASIPATLVFVLYAGLPSISIFFATRGILQGTSDAPFFALLGLYNLSSGFLRWFDDLRNDAGLEHSDPPHAARAKGFVRAVRETLWLVLLADFVIEELLGRVCRLHTLRFLGPAVGVGGTSNNAASSGTTAKSGTVGMPKSNATLLEYRTLAFAAGLLAAWAQVRVLDLLQRRTVLMRLLGARQAILVGASLLFMGVSAFSQYKRTVTWLGEISPTPVWCSMVLWIRQFGAPFSAATPIALHALLSDWLSPKGASAGEIVIPSLLVGAAFGHGFCWTMTRIWREKGDHLSSDYRVLHLLPRTSAGGRRLASAAMQAARRRCAEGATTTAVEWAASRFVRGAANYLSSRVSSG